MPDRQEGVLVPTTPTIHGEQNPVDVLRYSVWHAVRYLRVTMADVQVTASRDWNSSCRWRDQRAEFFRTDVQFASSLSFRNLVNIFAWSSLTKGEWSGAPKWDVGDVRGFKQTYPFDADLSNGKAFQSRLEQVAKWFGARPHSPSTDDAKRLLLEYYNRIDFDPDGNPLRLYPFAQSDIRGASKDIVIDPAIRSGQPTIAGFGLPTEMIFDRHQAGDSIKQLADDYDLPESKIEESIRYEAGSVVFCCQER